MPMKVVYANVNGQLLSETRAGARKLYSLDPLGNTRALYDNTLTKTDTFEYFPSGTVAARTGTTPTPFQWVGGSGYYRDNSKRVHVRARNFYVNLGRWAETDPIGFGGGDYNLYRYVKNRFVIARDPSGLVTIVPALLDFWIIDPACVTKTSCGRLRAFWNFYTTRLVQNAGNKQEVLPNVFIQRVGLTVRSGGNVLVRDYCEAWTVWPWEDHSSVVDSHGYTDEFFFPNSNNKGSAVEVGEVKFFKNTTMLPNGKTVAQEVGEWTQKPALGAGSLPVGPCLDWFDKIKSDDGVSALHYASSSWDCTNADKRKWKNCSHALPM